MGHNSENLRAVAPGLAKRIQQGGQQVPLRIEQVIAHFKTRRIMHTDYRRPIETFPETISAVIGLHFYRLAE
jgi:hypothetical protein